MLVISLCYNGTFRSFEINLLITGNALTSGTSSPFSIIWLSFCPRSEPDCTSFLSRSPVDRWVNPYFFTILSHCVPLPDPGPPVVCVQTKPISQWWFLWLHFVIRRNATSNKRVSLLKQSDYYTAWRKNHLTLLMLLNIECQVNLCIHNYIPLANIRPLTAGYWTCHNNTTNTLVDNMQN